jgi:precorrin-6B methylase 2
VQLSCAETRAVGRIHMLTAQNPIFILSGGGVHE